jgi:hypothetical protein
VTTSPVREARAVLLANLEKQRLGCELSGSPFYAGLLDHLIADVAAGGPSWRVLEPYAAQPFEPVYPLRLLAGVHRLVLTGARPALAARYPSTGGDGDADAAWPELRALLEDPPPSVLEAFGRAVQTNEVGRSVSLVGGLLLLASRTRRPVRLLELGSSAGLNLRVDRYWYEQDGRGWGDPSSPLRFVDWFDPAGPPFDAPLEIVGRRGCDLDPIDAASDDGATTLLSYLWPGMTERFDATAAALAIARDVPVDVDRADAGSWLPAQLDASPRDAATVVWHSIVWQYLPATTKTHVTRAIERAGARATADAPIAWLRLEPPADAIGRPDLRLRVWPDGRDELVATAGFHRQAVQWCGAS